MTQYLIQKYIEYGLLKKDGTHVLNEDEDFDPYIYPAETKSHIVQYVKDVMNFLKHLLNKRG